MGVGIALGNTIDSVGPALQQGEFVGVSIPIGTLPLQTLDSCNSRSYVSSDRSLGDE